MEFIYFIHTAFTTLLKSRKEKTADREMRGVARTIELD